MPCAMCVRFEYDCHYHSAGRKRLALDPGPQVSITDARAVSPSVAADSAPSSVTGTQLQSLEANSGAAFLRKLAMGIDPANAPRLQLFAWNLFNGSRKTARVPCVRPIVEIISLADMESLITVYFNKVHPCYGFVDRALVEQHMQARWATATPTQEPYDAVLCGIAALGYLFSCKNAVDEEQDLVETAKHILEQSTTQPGIDAVTSWALRVAYLRITAPPHIAWMASCTLMHTLEASGIVSKHVTNVLVESTQEENASPELVGRLWGVANHLNIWMSFDLGRSRVVLHDSPSAMPSPRPGDYIAELLSLLPYSESLDPHKNVDLLQLRRSLSLVLSGTHSIPPSVLAQSNLALCICRRLRALDSAISGDLLRKVLDLASRGIAAALAMLREGSPWHHVANVPFQIVCILLAIDNAASLARLKDAIKALSEVARVYDTEAAHEALSTACLLVLLHQRQKEQEAKELASVLAAYSPAFDERGNDGYGLGVDGAGGAGSGAAGAGAGAGGAAVGAAGGAGAATGAPAWLENLTTDFPNLQDFDIDQFLCGSGQWDVPESWMYSI
ncbi:uncharacterized protein K452DRAFT_293360 [Aplosporella prunicola CBS 121167]|uniref:Transcription factor domain-containing protein n=1 Tax=Aplosporella prunicola CBS 121167 TaxID=1176127 RepID=A0A6A6AWA7_9PEZI|nr:uncharacterized protein K452DRAFT_293360 [Aplosporella prunicola CBS 121167]KAF2135255.1 hypothetical protein K452DRAFT_293360 [Aplosporella prunicola CBS 121167]